MGRDGANDQDPQQHDGKCVAPGVEQISLAQGGVEALDEDSEKWGLKG